MNLYVETLVILVTSGVVIGVPAWLLGRHTRRVPVARLADPAPLPGDLPIAGRLELPAPNAGAADPAQMLQPFDLMTVLSDGYSRGLAAASQAEVADQMAVLIAEMRAEQWRGEG